MGAAVPLRDVVGEAQGRLVVAVVPLERGLDLDAVALAGEQDRRLVDRGLGAVQVGDEGHEAAVVVEDVLGRLGVALIAQQDRDAGVQEGELAQAMLQDRVAELGVGKDLDRGHEGELGAAPVDHGAGDRERRHRLAAVAKAHHVLLVVAPDPQLQPLRKRVDDRDADAVQAARDLVGVVVELAARVQHGHDHLGGRHALALVDVDRDAAAVVADGDRAVGVQDHLDPVAIAGERFVDRVVDDLEHHVVQAGAVVGIADVHARPTAHRLQALEDLDRGRVVGLVRGRLDQLELCGGGVGDPRVEGSGKGWIGLSHGAKASNS